MVELLIKTLFEESKENFGKEQIGWIVLSFVYLCLKPGGMNDAVYVILFGLFINRVIPTGIPIKKIVYILPKKKEFARKYILSYSYMKEVVSMIITAGIVAACWFIGMIDISEGTTVIFIYGLFFIPFFINPNFGFKDNLDLGIWGKIELVIKAIIFVGYTGVIFFVENQIQLSPMTITLIVVAMLLMLAYHEWLRSYCVRSYVLKIYEGRGESLCCD